MKRTRTYIYNEFELTLLITGCYDLKKTKKKHKKNPHKSNVAFNLTGAKAMLEVSSSCWVSTTLAARLLVFGNTDVHQRKPAGIYFYFTYS